MQNTKSNGNNVALKAGLWYVISSIMVKMISVITTPIFTRVLDTNQYGEVATFSSWYAMLIIIYGLNLHISIGRAKIDFPDKLDEYIGSIQLLSLMFSVLLSVILLIFIGPVSGFFEITEMETLLLLTYLVASPSINFYQSSYRYKYLYKQNIAIAWYITLSTVVLSLVLIHFLSGDNALLRIIGIVVPNVLLAIVFCIKSFKKGWLKINLQYWKYGLQLSLPMILHTISMSILSQSDRIVISKFCGQTPVAFYSLIRNYALLLFIITDAINQAWLPWFHDNFHANNKEEIRKNTNLLVIFICYLGLACVAIGPEAILLLGGKQYMDSIGCLLPMVMGVVCQCLYTHYINIEIHMKKTKYASIGTLIATVVNIALNFIFVPLYGYTAAAFTTLVSYFLLLILHCIFTKVKLKINLYDDKFIFGSMIVTMLLSVVVSLTYSYLIIRYCLIFVGFLSFLFVFRKNIAGYVAHVKSKFTKHRNKNS